MSALKKLLQTLLEILVNSSNRDEVTPSATARRSANRRPTKRVEPERTSPPPPPPPPAHAPRSASDAGSDIRSWVGGWKGVPYRMGGTDRSGVDCSGFVRAMYGDLFDHSLPRTSRDQARQGSEIPRNNLEPGDLVFFKINERTRHVGAYVGGGRFGHASTSKGPMISSLDSDYWKTRYWTARRVL